MRSEIHNIAEAIPEHQTERGDEFRELSTEEIIPMARALTIARSQANAANADWSDMVYISEMVRKKNRYFYHAGELGVSIREAHAIWWSVVHNSPAPVERREMV